ncbi:MAG: hypothetical protein U9R53_04290 [Chloroflexota bacterium]|nr:hypothetical protein [Chloroflexota bacterium]
MKLKRLILLITAAISLLLLSGCMTLLQEMTIQQDGSGTLRFALGVETEFYPQFQEMIPEGYELENLLTPLLLDENVNNIEKENFQSGGLTWEAIQMDIPDVALVFEEDRSFGPVTLSISQDQGVYTLEQTLDLAESNMSIPGVNLLDLTGAEYTVRLITPQITDTNGIQEEAGTSVWEVSVSELVQGGEIINLQADYVLEPYEGTFIAWETFFPYVVIGFLATGVISILVVIIVNTTGKREKKREIKF